MPSAKSTPVARPEQRRVLLVDDHPVVREGLVKRVNNEDDLVVCCEAESTTEALQAVGECQPDIVVLDLALREGRGLELIKELRAMNNPVPILVFTMLEESIYALRVLQAGAQGYLMKHEPSERLLHAIRTILKGDYAMSQQTANRFLHASLRPAGKRAATPADCLGDRELEVFELIGKGVGTRQIATQLGRSIKTIETYRARIKSKLQLRSATALVREAVRWVESRQ